MDTDYQNVLDSICQAILEGPNHGEVAQYIPELARIDPEHLGVCVATINDAVYGAGEWKQRFSIQSIAKVFALCLAYRSKGEELWKRVGVEPSGTPFNSLVQLEADNGIPRNPLINAGAMVICDVLISTLGNAKQEFLSFINEVCGIEEISFNPIVAKSEASVGYRNIALCNFIKSFGNIENDPNEVLELYFHICSVEMSCQELTKAFMFLVDSDHTKIGSRRVLSIKQTKRINAIMQTCGFYDESGEFSSRVGLPGKSGVGGGIVAVHPQEYCIAVWSPRLNTKGNSFRGMRFLEAFTSQTKLSIF